MATSEAQKRATAKYEAANVKKKLIKFHKKDHDLYDWVSSQPSQNAYVMGLIRADMEKCDTR